MTQFFFPFTSIDGDRRYNARDFANYFHSIFTDGVIATVKDKLRVSESESTGMHVVVNTGAAFIHGHLYLLSEPLTVDVTPGNSTGDRVDSIVLQLDHLERNMKILYKQNSTSVQRDENYWELQLATINVPRNATKVLNSQINDKRADQGVGGYSKLQGDLDVEGMEQHYESLLQQLSTDMAQWVTGKKVDFQGDWDAWFTSTQNTLDQLVTDMQGWTDDKQLEFQTDWDTWFATVQDALDGDTAGELLSMITQLQTDLGNIDAPSTQEFESLQTDFSAHQAEKVHQGEIHGFRLTDGKLEYFDGLEWQRIRGEGYPVGNVSNFNAKGDDTTIELTWSDPEDVTITDSNDNVITIARWKGTRILRKTGSYPVNENDGVLVVDNGIKNQYQTNGFVDTGLTNDVDYHYMAFPYTEEDVFTVDEVNRVIGTPTELQLYGFEIDETNSNPKTAVTYIEDAIGMTPASGNDGNFNWGSWEPFIKEISKPVVMKAGVEQYDLNYDDYTKKASGGNSTLTGADGDVFTRLQHLHMRYEKITNGHRWLLASKPFEGSFSMTEELENGYNQFNNPILVTLQNLYLLIFKDRDSQTALGRGRVDGTGYIASGNTNDKGYMFGSTQDLQMKFLGIEDFWGNKLQWVDGLMTDSNYNLLLSTKNFNDTGSGYEKQNTTVSANLSGYFTKVQGGKGGYAMGGSNGSETTHYADYGYLDSSRLAGFGGVRGFGGLAGAFCVQVDNSASDSDAALSARLCYKNAEAVYIGAYLGFEQSGKLRSISGNMPTDTKTIGAFRTLAKANNN